MINLRFILMSLAFLAGSCGHKKSKQQDPAPAPTPELELMKSGVWAARLIRPRDTLCSVFYDFRRANELDFHIACLSIDHKSIHLESYLYSTKASGKETIATLVHGTCPQATPEFAYFATPFSIGKTVNLSFVSKSESLYLDYIPGDFLSDDLKTATTLYGKPVVRGCFTSPSLEPFVAEEASR